MSSISVACPVEDCEEPIKLEVSIDPGERAITDGPSDHWHPGSGPSVELDQKLPEECPSCHTKWDEEQIIELEKLVEFALDNFDFDGAAHENERYPEPEDYEDR